MSHYDDYDNGPTKAECDAEAWDDEVSDAVSADPRGGRIKEVLEWIDPKRYPTLFASLDDELERITSDIKYDMADNAAYHRDIYAYHGVKRSDF